MTNENSNNEREMSMNYISHCDIFHIKYIYIVLHNHKIHLKLSDISYSENEL